MTPASLFAAFSVIAAAVLAAVTAILTPITLGTFVYWILGGR